MKVFVFEVAKIQKMSVYAVADIMVLRLEL